MGAYVEETFTERQTFRAQAAIVRECIRLRDEACYGAAGKSATAKACYLSRRLTAGVRSMIVSLQNFLGRKKFDLQDRVKINFAPTDRWILRRRRIGTVVEINHPTYHVRLYDGEVIACFASELEFHR